MFNKYQNSARDLTCREVILEQSLGWRNTSFFPTTPYLHVLSIVTPIIVLVLFGIILGKHLIKEIKTEGSWRVNFPKLIILGICPFLLVILLSLISLHLDWLNLYMLENLVLILCGY